MKILIVSTNDYRGGAAKVAYGLALQFLEQGHQVRMYVSEKTMKKPWIVQSKSPLILKKLRHLADRLPAILFTKDKSVPFTLGRFGENLDRVVGDFKPDVINIHWVGKGFVSFDEIARLSRRYPVVRTLHDRASFSGGYFLDKKLMAGNRRLSSLSKWNLKNKIRALRHTKLNIIAPSRSIAKFTRQSELFRNASVTIINNGIDLNAFKSRDRSSIRRKFGLKQNKKYILFGAGDILRDRAKGFDLLTKTLLSMKEYLERNNIGLVSFGSTNPFTTGLMSIKVEKKHVGYINSPKKMAQVYSMSDLFIFPSKTENYPLSLLECIACKTPVAAFRVGGVPEIVTDRSLGLLAKPFDIEQLRKNIINLLKRKDKEIIVPRGFSIQQSANRYLKLFREIAAV